jgi:hypothetical protein
MPKAATRCIRDRLEGKTAGTCKAVYAALRELANDARLPEGPVQLGKAAIANCAGFSYNTAAAALELLESAGVVNIERRPMPNTKAHAPSVYTFPKSWVTLPKNGATFPKKAPSGFAESIKEQEEQKEFIHGGPAAPAAVDESIHASAQKAQDRKRFLIPAKEAVFRALAKAGGVDLVRASDRERQATAREAAELFRIGATPDQIDAAGRQWPKEFSVPPTPAAIVKHWSRLTRHWAESAAQRTDAHGLEAELRTLEGLIAPLMEEAPSGQMVPREGLDDNQLADLRELTKKRDGLRKQIAAQKRSGGFA